MIVTIFIALMIAIIISSAILKQLARCRLDVVGDGHGSWHPNFESCKIYRLCHVALSDNARWGKRLVDNPGDFLRALSDAENRKSQ